MVFTVLQEAFLFVTIYLIILSCKPFHINGEKNGNNGNVSNSSLRHNVTSLTVTILCEHCPFYFIHHPVLNVSDQDCVSHSTQNIFFFFATLPFSYFPEWFFLFTVQITAVQKFLMLKLAFSPADLVKKVCKRSICSAVKNTIAEVFFKNNRIP